MDVDPCVGKNKGYQRVDSDFFFFIPYIFLPGIQLKSVFDLENIERNV